jgi:hypothetical protein
MAKNATWREIHKFVAFSGVGKKQAAYDDFMLPADIDTRDACRVEQNDNVTRTLEYDCDGVDLTGEPISRRFAQFRFTYEKFTGQMAARFKAYEQGVSAASTGAAANEVQTITRNGTVSGGTFTIGLSYQGRTGTTEAIQWNASNADILAALTKKTGSANAMGKIIKPGDIAVSGDWGTAITLTFGGRYANANMPEFTTVDTSLTGGGSLDVATTVPGDSELHAISRSTDGSLPPFSFAMGDKNESVATQIFGNCAVESMDFDLTQENAGMVVVVNAYYVPEKTELFDVPACVNITPVKSQDCALYVNSTWETENVFSLGFTSANNIPVEAAYGYDDIDMTEAWQRGDIPTQSFNATIFGTSDYALYQLAEAEETTGNEVGMIAYIGRPGDRLTITAASTKIYFGAPRMSFEGPLRKSAIVIIGSPHGSSPVTYAYNGTQTASFLVAST